MIISDYLLFPNSTEVLLHGRLGSIHPGFESTMKTLNHVPLQIREDFTFLWSAALSAGWSWALELRDKELSDRVR